MPRDMSSAEVASFLMHGTGPAKVATTMRVRTDPTSTLLLIAQRGSAPTVRWLSRFDRAQPGDV
jgi:hypothetical protein